MGWFSTLVLALGLESRRQKKAQQKQIDMISTHRSEISNAIFALDSLLSDLSSPTSILAVKLEDLDALKELAPLFPISKILSMQGYIGPEQQLFLQDHINLTPPRYNLRQFTKAVIEREGVYPEWHDLADLDLTYCGQIWRTLIELVCRERVPEIMQQIFDLLGKILYHFWFLEHKDMKPAQVCYRNILSSINMHANREQKNPYLHAVMLLQHELSKKYGGTESDFIPCLDPDPTYDMEGRTGLVFWAHRKDDFSFAHIYAVRKQANPSEPDLIWELPAGGGTPTIFFSE